MSVVHTAPCMSESELQDAFSERARDGSPAHLRGCEACSREWRQLEELARAAREIPVPVRPERAQAEARARLLARAASQSARADAAARRRRWALGASAVAAAVALLLLVAGRLRPAPFDVEHAASSSARPPLRRGHVHGGPGARFIVVREQPDEVVRLFDGTIALAVDPLGPGERFRVLTGDGEVEVRGTILDVRAESDHLVSVRVSRGRVEVRLDGTPEALIDAGERWTAPTAAASSCGPPRSASPGPPPGDVVPAPESTRAAHGRRRLDRSVSRPPSSPARPTPTPELIDPSVIGATDTATSSSEAAFREGWTALGAGDPNGAVAAFERVAPDSAVAEDTAYWRAVALSHAGRNEDAIRALVEFVARYPESPRQGQASVSLGWLLLRSGASGRARLRFRAALHDVDPAVRQSARRGLDRAVSFPGASPP